MSKEDWIESWFMYEEDGGIVDMLVIEFIADIRYHQGDDYVETVRDLFRSGYCWHFAHILRDSFRRGRVCMAAPDNHMVWMDDNIPYDIDGVYTRKALCFIGEEELGDYLDGFIHIPYNEQSTAGVSKQRLMLNHGYAFNGEKYVSIADLKHINDKTRLLKSMCGCYYIEVLNLLPTCWSEFDFDTLLITVKEALVSVGTKSQA